MGGKFCHNVGTTCDNVDDFDDYNDEIGDDKYKATPF